MFLRRKPICSDDRYSFRTNLILVRDKTFMDGRLGRFYAVSIGYLKLAYLLVIWDALLILYSFLTTLLCHARARS